ncbi:Rrf2 family transcriptional regulator [Bacillus wiedmannii]|uniref:Rrf2 family transcriptional regulator n=1 Tax=Bacillus wiedmannii TaxID=1890302 RepID=UPI002E21773B|nr:Rrf2 family transcriptional regulator [Bacillus wiedmannii]
MKISISLTVALQILSILKKNPSRSYCLEFIAKTLSVHPKVIHSILLCLRDTGIVHGEQKGEGWYLIKDVHLITLLDVYRSVYIVEEKIFSIHKNLNLNCPIGANIQFVLEIILIQAQDEREKILKNVTMGQLIALLNNENDTSK